MSQRVADAGFFPTDPYEIEHVVELLIGEAAGETWGTPSASLRTWLANELRRCPQFEELPEQSSDATYSPGGYWRACAELHVWLWYLAQSDPDRWETPLERERERERLLAAITSIALQVRQYVDGVHIETVAAALPALHAVATRAARAKAGRAAKGAEKARRAREMKIKDRVGKIEAEIRKRWRNGEPWRGMPGRIERALGVPRSTASDHVRRVRALIEAENRRR
ncbi:hypothetical protein FBR04_08435 [Betaproteobacteria bacterium PRO7]|nr:hypothetical protein [Betaproteobacteria bacterium PRO7]